MATTSYDLTPEQVDGKKILVQKGKSAVNLTAPYAPRDFDHTRDVVLPGRKREGLIAYGKSKKYDKGKSKWNERKFRFSGADVGDNRVVVRVGLTDFAHYKADDTRSEQGNRLLQELAKQQLGDKWAYHARSLGVAFLAISSDGSAFVSERINTPLYPSWVNGAAGFYNFSGQDPTLEGFYQQAVEELKQEFGKRLKVLDSRFVGIASHHLKGDADMTWIGRVDAPAEYFRSGQWLGERKDAEHDDGLVEIATLMERDNLVNNLRHGLRSFKGLMPSTELALRALAWEDLQ